MRWNRTSHCRPRRSEREKNRDMSCESFYYTYEHTKCNIILLSRNHEEYAEIRGYILTYMYTPACASIYIYIYLLSTVTMIRYFQLYLMLGDSLGCIRDARYIVFGRRNLTWSRDTFHFVFRTELQQVLKHQTDLFDLLLSVTNVLRRTLYAWNGL